MERLVGAIRGARRWGATFAVAIGLLAIAGCGGGDSTAGGTDSSSTVAATITKAELIKKGDAICRKTDAMQKSAYGTYETLNKEAMVTRAGREEAIVRVGLPPIEVELERLSALGAPKGDEERVNEILEALNRAIKNAKRNPRAVTSVIPDPFFQRVERLAKKYGFKDCAKAL